jgi:D-alanine-D-alanine ligase
MECSDESQAFYDEVKTIAKTIDVRVLSKHRWSSSDICHIQKNVPRVDGLGPIGEFLPSANERILRHSLIERSLLLALILNHKQQ